MSAKACGASTPLHANDRNKIVPAIVRPPGAASPVNSLHIQVGIACKV